MTKIRRNISLKLFEQYKRDLGVVDGIEYDLNNSEMIHPDIEKKLKNGNHHLGTHPSFPELDSNQNFGEKLASKSFKDIVKKVKKYSGVKDITEKQVMEMRDLLEEIISIEKNERNLLEKLAIDIVKKEFGITDQLLFDAKLVDAGNINFDENVGKNNEIFIDFDNAAEEETIVSEVEKQKLLNVLAQGAAKKGHYMFHRIEDELDKIDTSLSNLYGKLMSISDFTYWITPDEAMMIMVGGNENLVGGENIDLTTTPPTIKAKALTFPILVQELITGIMKIMSMDALPGDENIKKYVDNKCKFVTSEFWDVRLGPGLWDRFKEVIGTNDQDLKYYLYNEISLIPAKEFNSFMNDLFKGDETAKQKLVDMANNIREEMKEDNYTELIGYYDNDNKVEDDIDIIDLFR